MVPTTIIVAARPAMIEPVAKEVTAKEFIEVIISIRFIKIEGLAIEPIANPQITK
jgi:hypothetical protein